jgi:hypothetical protein
VRGCHSGARRVVSGGKRRKEPDESLRRGRDRSDRQAARPPAGRERPRRGRHDPVVREGTRRAGGGRAPVRRPELRRVAVRARGRVGQDRGGPPRPEPAGGDAPHPGRDPVPGVHRGRGRGSGRPGAALRRLLRARDVHLRGRRALGDHPPQALPDRRAGHRSLVVRPRRRRRRGDDGGARARSARRLQRRRRRPGAGLGVAAGAGRSRRRQATAPSPDVGREACPGRARRHHDDRRPRSLQRRPSGSSAGSSGIRAGAKASGPGSQPSACPPEIGSEPRLVADATGRSLDGRSRRLSL